MPRSRLIAVRAPNATESEAGAEIVFERVSDGVSAFIKASYCDGSYQQWGAPTPILGDNVEVVTRWADGMREVYAMVVDADEPDESDPEDQKAILIAEGYTVEEPYQGTFRFRDPTGDLDDDNYGSEPWAWEGAWEDYVKYRK